MCRPNRCTGRLRLFAATSVRTRLCARSSSMRKFVFLLLIAVSMPGILHAADEGTAVKLLVGRSAIVDFGSAIARVSLTSPDIADALVTSPNQLLVNGKMPGTISMFVWDRAGAIRRYEVS